MQEFIFSEQASSTGDLARFATRKLFVPVRKWLKRQRYFNSTFLAVQSSEYSYTSLQYDSAI